MKKLLLFLFFAPTVFFAADKIPSKIKSVILYANSADISRVANLKLSQGTSEITLTSLSPKIDESSIQIAGLNAVSILAITYNLNYLENTTLSPDALLFNTQIEAIALEISLLKNTIFGLNEEEKVLNTNRLVSSETQALDLDKIKAISQYYRNRITAIKNEIFNLNLKINVLNEDITNLQKQLATLHNTPSEPKGEITIKFDAPMATSLNLAISYNVQDAGWIPNYDLKSNKMNDPLSLTYKAHVYQKTGENWDNVALTLATGNPNYNAVKPDLAAHYLNFGQRNSYQSQVDKSKYRFNPSIQTVTGIVTDESGQPLPGCSVLVKGTNIGTQTDFDGRYSLNVANGQDLVFSYVGFKSNEIPIYSSLMNLRLEEDAEALEEVVVVAYGSTSNISSRLAGSSSGIRIRGNSSIGIESQPLYIIDGVPMDGFMEGDLDADEIQHLEVLNDESSLAIYGSRAANGIIVITTKKSTTVEEAINTKFEIKKPYSISANGEITAIEINTYTLDAKYEFFAAPIINENVFLTASFKDWEKLNLLPGEANIYFSGTYAGKTTIDPYAIKKEMTVSLGIDNAITVTRKQDKNFKSKSFTGSNRVLDRTYQIDLKNNKPIAIDLVIMDRIPISENKEIKVDDIITNNASYDTEKGLLTWKLSLKSNEETSEKFSFQVKYPKGRNITL
ncbi:MAG: mucoidy inhibitor MuiA family protein [Cellulophaga sp.]|nr:mucoidy inhibitor MuiA family protein [Cellulophaga sp.]